MPGGLPGVPSPPGRFHVLGESHVRVTDALQGAYGNAFKDESAPNPTADDIILAIGERRRTPIAEEG